MDRLLNVVTGMSVLLIGLVFFAIRRAHIRVEYSISWLSAFWSLILMFIKATVQQRFSIMMIVSSHLACTVKKIIRCIKNRPTWISVCPTELTIACTSII